MDTIKSFLEADHTAIYSIAGSVMVAVGACLQQGHVNVPAIGAAVFGVIAGYSKSPIKK